MSEHVLSLSDFKTDASQLLRRMQEDDASPLVLTQNGRASAVVQSYDAYQRMQKMLTMLKLLALSEADIQSGRLTAQDKLMTNTRKRLQARLKAHA